MIFSCNRKGRVVSAFLSIVGAGLLIGGLTSTAWGQSASSGTLSGQVTDPQGAIIPGAVVKLTDRTTNTSKTNFTNDTGRYDFFNVSPGAYDVLVSRPGFSETKLSNQQVDVGAVLTLNVKLQVGSSSTIVEVAATAGAELQTSNATVGSTISGIQLDSLPNIGRDANAFFVLQPGVSPGGNVSGTVSDQNTFQLDGGNNSSDMDGSQTAYTLASGAITGSTGGTPSGVMPTPIESIEEFRVGTTNQTADFNGSAGGQVQMVTKRGTNKFHGSAYDYFLSSYFSANSWKNDHTASGSLPYTPIAKTHQNRFGGALGGPLAPKFWGGKTYFFANYEGRRFPQSTTIEKTVPTATLRAGVILLPNSAGTLVGYNLNPTAVTVGGVTYQPTVCPAGSCDPRGIGLNSLVKQVWNTQLPMPNDPQAGDTYNTQGYLTNISIPQTSNFGVIRLDHDFGDKWHLTGSYRYYALNQLTSNQVDIGGVLAGDKLGQAVALAPRVQKPSYYVAGLTTTISPTLTNDFHVNYLRNYWEWGTVGAPTQIAGLGGALEIGGESSNALIPYNVNSQSVRQRFWDGQDWTLRDDISKVQGNHLFQFGGNYQHNFNYHQRDDNGAGIFNNTVYQIANGAGLNFASAYIPTSVPTSQISSYETFYTEILGIVSQPQVLQTRAGANLALQPLGTNLSDKVTTPYYNVYFSDTWHMRKNFTLTYGLGYQIEQPPTEQDGKQVLLVDAAGNQIATADFLAARQKAALAGQTSSSTYDPIVGFATINNVGSNKKYPYNPFYGGLSPRIAAAWNPNYTDGILGKVLGSGKTVVRGGYSRLYGRLNGVNQVLVPLLGTGLAQPLSCVGASKTGQCLGTAGVDPSTAFRIGTDGLTAPLPSVTQTLAQPYYPGIGGNAAAGDGSVVDPNYKPNRSDSFDLTIQRQLSNKVSIEVGYIGRIIRNEFQEYNLDSVPYMTTLNGQSFANAFANLYTQLTAGQTITAQPFFESALGGSTGSYCAAYSSCIAAVAALQKTNISSTRVYTLWSALNKASSWTLGRTLLSSAPSQVQSIFVDASNGYGNYNAAFLSLTVKDFHGLTARSNFTWSRAMGTGAVSQSSSSYTVLDPWNLHAMYGPQSFDIRFVYNLGIVYQPKWFEGKGLLHSTLGGWNFSPLFTAQSGAPLSVNISGSGGTDCESFGESNCASGSTNENAVLTSPYTAGNSAHENVTSTTNIASAGNAAKGGSGLNIFADPNAVYSQFRRLILGVDTTGGGAGVLRALPTWNLDMAISKDFKVVYKGKEGIGLTFNAQFSNMLNHFQPGSPSLNIDTPTSFGVISTQGNSPRQMEFGLRLHF